MDSKNTSQNALLVRLFSYDNQNKAMTTVNEICKFRIYKALVNKIVQIPAKFEAT